MMSKAEAGNGADGDSNNGQLLEEIEAISKALYLDKNPLKTSVSGVGSRLRSAGKTHLPDPKLKNKLGNEEQAQKDKKSIWNWKPLKALSHRNRRFNCCFTLQVHNIENLSPSFEDLSLFVHWKRRDGSLVTRPTKVLQGMAEFEESLMHSCSVYGSRSGPHHSAKYESKHFLLYAVISGAPEVDLGKHRVDLTRLLPLTLEELEEDKSSGKWTTSFKLSGKGKGATLNVSFGYLVIGDNGKVPGVNQNLYEGLNLKENSLKQVRVASQGEGRNAMRRSESLPNVHNRRQLRGTSPVVENIKDLHEVLPACKSELASRVDILNHKLEEDKSRQLDDKPELEVFTGEYESVKSILSQVSDNSKLDGESEVNEFSVIEQGVEVSTDEQATSEEVITKDTDVSVSESHNVVEADPILDSVREVGSESLSIPTGMSASDDKVVIGDSIAKDDEFYSKETIMRELESALDNVTNLALDALDSPEEQEDPLEVQSTYGMQRAGRSLSLDVSVDSVASDFLDMLGIEHSPFGLSSESEPESPRERLLRQFEQDALASGCSLFNFGIDDENSVDFRSDAGTGSVWENGSENFRHPRIIQIPEEEHQGFRSRTNAKLLEDLETEALMREWGLNEKSFQSSPPSSSGAFGSPIDLAPEEPIELPSLGEGLGPYLQTKSGGFLRSMNPSIFKGAQSGGSLIMQASSPVVVPAEMGSGIMEILQHLASIGIEKLSVQANKLMPLEDITGKTMQQVAWEALPSLEGSDRHGLLQHEMEAMDEATSFASRGIEGSFESRSSKYGTSSRGDDISGSEYVSLEDLAPLAMNKIEALSMEGLRIQSGMSDEEAPSNISAQSIGEFSALRGTGVDLHGGSLGLEGTGGLQLLDIKDGVDDEDGLMNLSLSLDEWMKLDSGELDDEDHISERTSRILAAHHANSLAYIRGGSKGDRRRGKNRKCGLLGNNFTVALMVQLRDPLRNYELVGAPMLALIQVERVFVPPKPTIYRKVSEVKRSDDNDEENALKPVVKEETKEEEVPIIVAEEAVPQFQITEVHVAGFRSDPGKKKLWGSSNQQQSGSRWLLANGMGKSNKHPFTKPKPVGPKFPGPATTKVQPGDTLWSISARVLGSGNKWKELAALNPHIRNPNIILPNETTIKLR